MKSLAAAKDGGFQPFVSQQIHYTLQAREAEYELVPISLDQGLGILVWSPIAGGLLSGKFRRGKAGPEGSRHFGRKWREPPIYDEEKLFDIVDVLLDIAKARKCSAARVALAWLLARPGVASVIIGGRTPEQFADNLAAADLKLSDEETARLEAVSRPPLLYPYWHQAWTAKDRLGATDLALLQPFLGSGSRRARLQSKILSPRSSTICLPLVTAKAAASSLLACFSARTKRCSFVPSGKSFSITPAV